MKPPKFLEVCELVAFGAAQCNQQEQQDAFALARTVYDHYFAGTRSHQQLCAFTMALIACVRHQVAAAASTQREKGVHDDKLQ